VSFLRRLNAKGCVTGLAKGLALSTAHGWFHLALHGHPVQWNRLPWMGDARPTRQPKLWWRHPCIRIDVPVRAGVATAISPVKSASLRVREFSVASLLNFWHPGVQHRIEKSNQRSPLDTPCGSGSAEGPRGAPSTGIESLRTAAAALAVSASRRRSRLPQFLNRKT
jgi:hypothetical protein